MKDGKFKINIDTVYCNSGLWTGNNTEVRTLDPSDEDPYPYKTGGTPKKKVVSMLVNLKSELQAIVDSYLITIKYTTSAGSSKDNW